MAVRQAPTSPLDEQRRLSASLWPWVVLRSKAGSPCGNARSASSRFLITSCCCVPSSRVLIPRNCRPAVQVTPGLWPRFSGVVTVLLRYGLPAWSSVHACLLRLRTGSDSAPERLPAPDPVLHVSAPMRRGAVADARLGLARRPIHVFVCLFTVHIHASRLLALRIMHICHPTLRSRR